MALKKSGVQLVAEGDSAFLAVMMQAGKAVVSFGATTDAAGRNVAAMQQRITRLTDTIGLQARQLGLMEQQLKETVAAQGAESLAAQKQQLSIDRLSASMRNNQATADRLTTEMAQLATAEGKAEGASSKLSEVLTGALRRAGELVINVMANVGQAIVSGIGEAVSMAGDYEQAMNVLQAQSGATDEQMVRIGATAKALGADLTLPATSAADAGKAMLELSKGGLDVEQSMAAAKGTLQLAAAAETDVATAANITTGALAAFGLAGSQAGQVADLLTNAANKSRASIDDVALGFQQAAFRFHSAGQGADDLAASLTILIQAGLRGSDAGTALQNALARLQGPTDKAKSLMRELGINVYDAHGNMLPMRQIIDVLNGAFKGMTQEERNAALQTIFLSDGMKAMIPLLGAGADGFGKVKTEMRESGSAAKMAEAQMKGLKGAAAGLTSQVETLALEALEPLLPIMTSVLSAAGKLAGSFVGEIGPAVEGIISKLTPLGAGLLEVGRVMMTGAVPALGALSAATVVYAVTNLPVMITALGAGAAAVGTFAGAMLLAVGPFAIIAGALGMVALAWTNFKDANKAAMDQMLSTKQFWTDSSAAIDNYGRASAETQAKMAPLAENVRYMREQIRGEIESLAMRREAGLVSDKQMQAELDTINMHSAGLQVATQALNDNVTAYQGLHDMDALEDMRALRQQQDNVTQGIKLTDDEILALQNDMDAAYKAGTSAVEGYVNAAITFNRDLTKAMKEGNAEQQQAVVSNYAQQASAARVSLGEQLIAYTVAYGRMRGVSEETLRAVVGQIETTFGTGSSIAGTAMLDMEGHIRDAMSGGGEAIAGLGQKLDGTADDAINLKEKMDALKGKYEAEILQNFKEGKIDATELRKAIDDIPRRINVEYHTQFTYGGERPPDYGGGSTVGSRAEGGPVRAGQPYLVGENGPELFMPQHAGTIVPPASPAQIMLAGATTITNSQSRTYNYSPTYAAAPRAPSVDFGTMAAFGG